MAGCHRVENASRTAEIFQSVEDSEIPCSAIGVLHLWLRLALPCYLFFLRVRYSGSNKMAIKLLEVEVKEGSLKTAIELSVA